MPRVFRFRRLRSLLIKVLLALFLAPVLPILLFRFMAPPVSALMVERRIESWFSKGKYSPTYDWVSIDKISPAMRVAVIAAEDQNFLTHYGFDWQAIQRAMTHNERSVRTRGASTLTQQTAKNLFLWSGRSWIRKSAEAYLTVLLEAWWSKRRILETYLNIVEFGDGIYGVEAASQRYFRKPASRLNVQEAALLAAVLPNPHRYKVRAPSGYVRERQQWIMQQMDQLGGASLVKTIE
jgi:monofunctional biosynthetic peptidoglycan transglycosylase